MNELTVKIENVNGQLVVSSRVIAEQLGKQHKHVLESIENIIKNSSADISALFIKSEYTAINGKKNPEYLLTQDGFTLYMFNIQGYNEYKLAYINEFNRMKQQLQNQYKIPANYPEALRLYADEVEKNEKLALENKVKEQQILELQPKALYYDLILQCKELLSTTMIAKDYGMSAISFNKLLHELGVQYSQSGIWFLYQKYATYGYTQTKTNPFTRTDGTLDGRPHMYWTQKGRLFLYNLLKEKNILPLIEKDVEVA